MASADKRCGWTRLYFFFDIRINVHSKNKPNNARSEQNGNSGLPCVMCFILIEHSVLRVRTKHFLYKLQCKHFFKLCGAARFFTRFFIIQNPFVIPL